MEEDDDVGLALGDFLPTLGSDGSIELVNTVSGIDPLTFGTIINSNANATMMMSRTALNATPM